uniref:Uncharacterized protein n=1 Tax=Leersia perrieri TaxID=77586 RepID=A0A0D9W6R9_9ORYZ
MDFAIGDRVSTLHFPLSRERGSSTSAAARVCAARWYCAASADGRALCTENMAERHTIILMQPSQNRATRTFMDFNSVNHALDGLYDQSLHAFLPYDRRWIKHKMFQHLKWLAQQ